MKINIYYGGRGLLDDPTLYVISRIENVLKELRVKVERYNIYEHKNEIATLPQTFRDVDGIILATTVGPDVNTFLLLFSSFFFSLQKSSPGRPPTPPLRPRPQRLPLPRGDYGAIYYIYIICKQGGPNHDPYRQSRQHPHHHWRLRAR